MVLTDYPIRTLAVAVPLAEADFALLQAADVALSLADKLPDGQAVFIDHANQVVRTPAGQVLCLIHCWEPCGATATDILNRIGEQNRPCSGLAAEVYGQGPSRSVIRLQCRDEAMRSLYDRLLEVLAQCFPEVGTAPAAEPASQAEGEPTARGEGIDANRPRRVSKRVRRLADEAKKLKDEHPDWAYYKVATKCEELLKRRVTEDGVRNAYRAMGWKWEPANRIR